MALIVLEEEGWGEGAPAKGYLAPEVFRVKKSARRRKGMLRITRDGWWNGMIGGWTVTEKQSLFFF